MKVRQSSKMSRLSTGDRFVDPNTKDFLKVVGWVRFTDSSRTKVQIPVQVDGGMRPSRRIFDADLRVALV